jgi:hypothetical protein
MGISRVQVVMPSLIAAVSIIAVLVTIERRDRVRIDMAVSRAEIPYRSAKVARERAEAAVIEYAEVVFRCELAAAEDEVKRAEDQLMVATNAPADWDEQIRAKGYLLFVKGPDHAREFNITKAVFAVEQARCKRRILVDHTNEKRLKELNARLAQARADESAAKDAYERAKASAVGVIGNVLGRR